MLIDIGELPSLSRKVTYHESVLEDCNTFRSRRLHLLPSELWTARSQESWDPPEPSLMLYGACTFY